MTAAALEAFAEEGVDASAFIGQVARGQGLNHYRWAAHEELIPMTLEAEIPFVEVSTKEFRMKFEVRAGNASLKRLGEGQEGSVRMGPTIPEEAQRKGIPAQLLCHKIIEIAKLVSHRTLLENIERTGMEAWNLHPLTDKGTTLTAGMPTGIWALEFILPGTPHHSKQPGNLSLEEAIKRTPFSASPPLSSSSAPRETGITQPRTESPMFYI